MQRTLFARLRSIVPESLVEQYGSLRLLKNRNVLLLSIANLLDEMSISLIVPLLPIYADQLGANPVLIGLIFSAETMFKALFSMPFGYVSDRLNRRVFIGVGLGLSAISVIAFGFVEAPILFVGLRAVDGMATAMRAPMTKAYIGDMADDDERGSAMGAYRTLGMLGVAVGPVLGGVLAATFALAVPFVVLGAATLVGSLVVFVGLEPQTRSGSESDETPPRLWELSPRHLTDLLTVPMLAVGVSVFVAQIGTGAFNSFFAVLMQEKFAVGPAYTGTMFSLFGASMFVLMPMGGTVADKSGRKPSVVLGKVTWAGVVIGLALAPTRHVPPVMMLLAGLGSAVAGPALGAIQYELAPDEYKGTVLGAYSTLSAAGMALGPFLGGAIVDRLGVMALFVAMGCLWLFDTVNVLVGVRETVEADQPESPKPTATADSANED